jgi:hypothetical protein
MRANSPTDSNARPPADSRLAGEALRYSLRIEQRLGAAFSSDSAAPAMPLRHDIAAVTANGRVVVSLAVRPNCHFIECPAMRALKFERTWCFWRHGQNQAPQSSTTRIDGAIGRLPMKVFLLLVTWFTPGQPTSNYQVTFSSLEACEASTPV